MYARYAWSQCVRECGVRNDVERTDVERKDGVRNDVERKDVEPTMSPRRCWGGFPDLRLPRWAATCSWSVAQ